MFDEMPRKKSKMLTGESSGGDSSTAPVDHLRALPDALLHHVMSFLRAWEVARTCVLSRRWRHLWATAPCVDLRVWRLGRHRAPPEGFARFVYCFLLERDASAPVDTLRLLLNPPSQGYRNNYSSPSCQGDGEYYSSYDVDMWIHAAIKRRARVIQLMGHPNNFEDLTGFERINIVSCHLKHLILSVCLLTDGTLRQLSSQCPSLEVLDLKDCYLRGREISSASLRSLSIAECNIMEDLTIAAPKDDARVHSLARLFMNNGVPIENIYVRQHSTCHPINPP